MEIVFPTDPFVGAHITYAWTVPQGVSQPQALTVVDSVNVTLSMMMNDAALLMTMIDRSGVQGAITFTLPDQTAFSVALSIDGNVVGHSGTVLRELILPNGTFGSPTSAGKPTAKSPGPLPATRDTAWLRRFNTVYYAAPRTAHSRGGAAINALKVSGRSIPPHWPCNCTRRIVRFTKRANSPTNAARSTHASS